MKARFVPKTEQTVLRLLWINQGTAPGSITLAIESF
jgi:hypothetical protein